MLHEMLFYPAVTLWVSRETNTSSTYQKVERRIIHSNDYQEMGSKQKDHPLSINPGFTVKEKLLRRGIPFISSLSLTIISQISFCNTERQKFNNTVIGHHFVLLGSRNYNIWSKCIIFTLSAYFVLEFTDGILMYAALLAEQNQPIVNRSENF